MARRPAIQAPIRPATSRAWPLAVLAMMMLASTALAAGPARLMVLQDDELGKYLTDDLGRGIYVFIDPAHEDELGTARNRPTPECDATCRAVWPPVVTDGAPVAVPAIEADRVGTIATDAGTQVTYDGWPLYRFVADRGRGDTKGEGIEPPAAKAFGGAWYLIAPDGTLVEPEETAAPDQARKGGGGNAGSGGGNAGGGAGHAYY